MTLPLAGTAVTSSLRDVSVNVFKPALAICCAGYHCFLTPRLAACRDSREERFEGRERERFESTGDPEDDFQDAQDALEELAEQEEEEEELEEVRSC
jgi:hypothetical protein